jgi:hypothetical protein
MNTVNNLANPASTKRIKNTVKKIHNKVLLGFLSIKIFRSTKLSKNSFGLMS